MSKRREVVLAVLAGLVLALAPGAAQAKQLRVGSTRYVRLVRLSDGKLTVVLTARGRKELGRDLRGKVLDATCTRLGRSVQGMTQSSSSSGAEGTVGPHGRATYHPLVDRRADFCDLGLARRTVTRHGESTSSLPGSTFDSIAIDQRGAAYLDEDRVTLSLLNVLGAALADARRDPGGHFPAPQKIVALVPRRIVPLASADATPPPGVVGFFSNGVDHAATVGLSTLGVRLFVDSNRGVLGTNAQEHLLRVTSGQAGASPALGG